MEKKTEMLQNAFREAYTLNSSMLGGNADYELLLAGVKTFVKREKLDATEEEMESVVKAGIKEIKAAGADFRIQTWTMK